MISGHQTAPGCLLYRKPCQAEPGRAEFSSRESQLQTESDGMTYMVFASLRVPTDLSDISITPTKFILHSITLPCAKELEFVT